MAGASSGQIMVYDVESRQRILNVYGHDDDGEFCRAHSYGGRADSGTAVNGVCFADESSTNVLVSASDDGYLKVWYVLSMLWLVDPRLPGVNEQGSTLPRFQGTLGRALRPHGRHHPLFTQRRRSIRDQ